VSNEQAHPDETSVSSLKPATFSDFSIDPEIVRALTKAGIVHPFPIQAMALPVALTGQDIIGQAKTGTGKTLGFGIPLVQNVCGPGEPGWDDVCAPGAPQALVVVPTRELAVQVAGDLKTTASLRKVRILTVYGGRAYEPQVEALNRGIELVVGTPGRLLDLVQKGHLSLGSLRSVVLDEADEMLDLGFLPDVERILALAPADRQLMLFSATMPSAVVALARRFMSRPTHIRAADPDDTGATVKDTAQFVYRAHAMDKVEMLARILQAEDRGLSMIFARTKRTVAKVADELADRGFAAAAIHGDLGQGAREQALRAFRNGKVDVLVATDVAARGIDVDEVTHVINYQCPEDEKTYLHRIGRTGRAGHTGTAVTFVDWDDTPRWALIDRALDVGIPQPVETYSSSEHLFTDLSIPEGTRGVLPRTARTRAGLNAEEVEDLGETGKGPRSRSHGPSAGRPRGRTPHRDRPEGERTTSSPDSADPQRPRGTRARRRTRAGRPVAATEAQEGTDRPVSASAQTGEALAAPARERPTDHTVDLSDRPGTDSAGSRRRRHRRRRGHAATDTAPQQPRQAPAERRPEPVAGPPT
jgi:superfamily II DNA/RNA helicase